MRAVWVYLLGLAAVAVTAVACGGVANDGTSATAEDVIESFDDVSSYRVEMYVDTPTPLVYEFEEPDSWHAFYGSQDARSGEVLGIGEVLYVGDDSFIRDCDGMDVGCGAWKKEPRGDIIVAAVTPSYLPQWPIVALQLADEKSVSTRGDELVVTGRVNVLRAILENLHVLTEEAGGSKYGRSCTSGVTPSEVNEQGTVVREGGPGSEVCRDTTYEELLEQEADDIANGDEHPATLTATIDAETLLPKSIEVRVPPREADREMMTLRFEYSRYNEVTVRAPE
jgi:hypothetical protein